jgi:Immunity protein Imm1
MESEMVMLLEYGEGPKEIANVKSVSQLDAELDRIEEAIEAKDEPWPCLANLIMGAPDGRMVSCGIGLGRDYSIALWTDDRDGTSSLSRPSTSGTSAPPADGEISWYLGNQWSFFPTSAAIDVGTARETIREFFQTQHRPTNVGWQQ